MCDVVCEWVDCIDVVEYYVVVFVGWDCVVFDECF